MKEYPPKPAFLDRMRLILGDEFDKYIESLKLKPLNSIRANTLKISPEQLVQRLKKKLWKISQPFEGFPEIIIVESELLPGEIGRSMEHLLGYYYVQDISSMLPVISLNPGENDFVLDLCAAPGSKTSQISAKMGNKGTIIANDVSIGRIKILASNLERCGAMNSIITKSTAESLCKKMKGQSFKVDKILLDAPCSGEGTMISNKKTALMWNPKRISILSRVQKAMAMNAFELLKPEGEMVYSTCTHAPEENEEVVDFLLKKFDNVRLEEVTIPKEMKFHQGMTSWQDKKYSDEIKKCVRIYPHDNKTEGFFIAKIRKTE